MRIPYADPQSSRPEGVGAKPIDNEVPFYTCADVIEDMLARNAARKQQA
jgi:hypothetical protein